MKLHSSDFKEIARACLKGNWMKAIISFILASVFGVFSLSAFACVRGAVMITVSVLLLETIRNYFSRILLGVILVGLFQFVMGEVVHLGYIRFNLSLLDGEPAPVSTLFSCMNSFGKAFYLRTCLFVIEFCGFVFFLLPGIYLNLVYAMAPYVLEERPEFPVIEALRSSRKMMEGNKLRLLKLRLSFIGWDFLSVLSLGLLTVYVMPLKKTAEAVFYNEISGRADAYYARDNKILP